MTKIIKNSGNSNIGGGSQRDWSNRVNNILELVKSLPTTKNDCGIQGMIKDDHIFTLQGHPEYLPSTVKTLLLLRKDIIPLKICQKGLKKLTNSTDSKLISKFIGNFFMNPNYLTDILSKSTKKIGVAKKVSQKKTEKKKN